MGGSAFHVKDRKRLEAEVLPKYFRHAKLTSFQRQLSLYGIKRRNQSDEAYSHPQLVEGRPDLVPQIKRKSKEGEDGDGTTTTTTKATKRSSSSSHSNNNQPINHNVQALADHNVSIYTEHMAKQLKTNHNNSQGHSPRYLNEDNDFRYQHMSNMQDRKYPQQMRMQLNHEYSKYLGAVPDPNTGTYLNMNPNQYMSNNISPAMGYGNMNAQMNQYITTGQDYEHHQQQQQQQLHQHHQQQQFFANPIQNMYGASGLPSTTTTDNTTHINQTMGSNIVGGAVRPMIPMFFSQNGDLGTRNTSSGSLGPTDDTEGLDQPVPMQRAHSLEDNALTNAAEFDAKTLLLLKHWNGPDEDSPRAMLKKRESENELRKAEVTVDNQNRITVKDVITTSSSTSNGIGSSTDVVPESSTQPSSGTGKDTEATVKLVAEVPNETTVITTTTLNPVAEVTVDKEPETTTTTTPTTVTSKPTSKESIPSAPEVRVATV